MGGIDAGLNKKKGNRIYVKKPDGMSHHRCKLSESLAQDLIEEIKVDFGVYERDNMIMFA